MDWRTRVEDEPWKYRATNRLGNLWHPTWTQVSTRCGGGTSQGRMCSRWSAWRWLNEAHDEWYCHDHRR